MLDGRHTGTGGGNHFVLGGATPARLAVPAPARPAAQPDRLLAQPSVAVATCSPACSSARPARRRASTRRATTRSTRSRSPSPSWRASPSRAGRLRRGWSIALLRNLLIDVTGNTHRAEFCIDKLYSPDGADRPPRPARDARLRDAAACAHEPGRSSCCCAPWSPASGPRRTGREAGALGHRAARPLHAAALRLGRLRRRRRRAERRRLSVRARLVRAASRVPLPAARRLQRARASQLELRQALEPWHVLGEESGAGGTARYVDSSVERLQVRVSGLVGDRHVDHLQRPARAAAADGHGRRVRRRRALPRLAAAPSSLHPTIAAHAPLVFDLVDTWMNRSLGGCQYHVAHPGGLNYDDLPGQRLRGRSRRLARFFRTGHTPGTRAASPPSRREPRLSAHPRSAARADRRRKRPAIFGRMLDQLLAGYAAPEERFDELLAAPGLPRPHWDAFVRAARRAQRARGERHALAHRAADPRARRHLQRLRRRAGRAPAVGGRPDSRSSCRPTSGRRSAPASRSAPTCSTASSAISTARRRC